MSDQYRRQIEGSDGMRAALGVASGACKTSSKVANPARLSQKRFDSMKVTDTFSSKSSSGDLPCHVQHGSCRNEIQWDISPQELKAQVWPLLITAASGLQHRTHPNAIKSRNGFADLCTFVSSVDPASLRQVAWHIRSALIVGLKSDKTFDVFFASLNALAQFSEALQSNLTSHLGPLLAPIAKAASSRNREVKEKIDACLNDIVKNCGDEAAKVIKIKIPCF